MHSILTVGKKEFGDAVRNKVFLTFFIFLILLTTISLYIGSVAFQQKVSVFQVAFDQLVQSGQSVANLTKPEFYPLQLLRASIEYLEIIGAVLAISLGYLSIAKEKGNNTLPLIFSRPVTKTQYYLGKMVGNAALICVVVVSIFTISVLLLTVIGGLHLSAMEMLKMALSAGATVIYLFLFFCFAALSTILMRYASNALIFSFVVWLIFVLVVPQIGDTMDTDNQIPGGFFNAIHVNKPESKIILEQFTTYETLRNGVEEASITKHYERLTFALLGIKDIYNGKSLGFIFKDKLNDILWILAFFIILALASLRAFTHSKTLLQKND
jgi:ABC-2 type transport system permease protein